MLEEEQEEEEDIPQLSASTLAALQDFHTAQDAQLERLNELRAQVEYKDHDRDDATYGPLSMRDFTEDWNASQFWYSDQTAMTYAKALLQAATSTTNIAIISTPSVFIQVKNLLSTTAYAGTTPKLSLFEFDDRFNIFKDNYVRYDSNYPLQLPLSLKGLYDRIICDPPFLSSDCQTNFATTVRWLLKPQPPHASGTSASKVIVCTGKVMEALVLKLYTGIQSTSFETVHERGRLHNEWGCYANFECEAWNFISGVG